MKNNESGVWYVVVNEGEIVAKSRDKDIAEAYAYDKTEENIYETASEYGIDPESKEAAWQNGSDGGLYEVERVDIPNDSDYETVVDTEGNIMADDVWNAEEINE